jgi:hypothetical protein
VFCAIVVGVFSFSSVGVVAATPIHGLWLWKSPPDLAAPHATGALLDFCKAEGINEVYVSISERSETAKEGQLVHLIGLLHRANTRVEALLSSTETDEPGKHREKLLRHVQEILQFNQKHSADRFDGIHLDIEPQQPPENKGPGNLRFVPGLADAFRAVCGIAEPAGMTVNADMQNKLLKGDLSERKMLLSAVPRVTWMMYELSSLGETPEQQAEKAQKASEKFLAMAYDGLDERKLAKMAIALRTPDYGALLPEMLRKLDEANRANPPLSWLGEAFL